MTTTPFEVTRQKLYTLIDAFHTAQCPTWEINYPKRFITDVEHATNPFIVVEVSLNFKGIELTQTCFSVRGQLAFNLFAKSNSGSKIFTDFSDKVANYFACKTLDTINFYEVNPYSNKNIPGFDGEMNIVSFDRDYFKS
jgi:hypothetical protein